MAWIALDTKSRRVGWTSKLTGGQFAAWVKFIMEAKDSGWAGRVNADYFDEDWLVKNNVTFDDWNVMLSTAMTKRAVVLMHEKYEIQHWKDYQRDPTNLERQRAFRENHPDEPLFETKVTGSNESNADRTGHTLQDTTGQDIHPAVDAAADVLKAPKEKTLHQRTIDYFCASWQTLYGSKYPFIGKDAAHVKKINDTVKEPAKIKATIDAYLACREPWFVDDHHSLGMLVAKLVKFVPVISEPTVASGKSKPGDKDWSSSQQLPRLDGVGK